MILKVLEWQTETSFCTVRIRGKQWYWIYKISLGNSSGFKKNNVILGRNNIIFFKNEKDFTLNSLLFKKKFFNKFTVVKTYDNRNFCFLNKNKFDTSLFSSKNNTLFFLKNKYNFSDFFAIKTKTKAFKTYNRNWVTIQQQPKTQLVYDYKFNFFFNDKISTYKNVNEFLKNSILNKNRLITVDNVLYLPVRRNITVITNSFDVVHS